MTIATISRKALSLILALTFVSATVVVLARAETNEDPPVGHLTVVGKVRVNGQPAATGDIVAAGSTVETAAKSSAVVSLGKLGRVEAQAETNMKLRYDDSSIAILLADGSVRVSTGPGVAATITDSDN